MADTFRSDGKAVEVALTKEVTKGDVVVEDGFVGVAQRNGVSGETVALEIALREHELAVPSGVTAAKGDVLYVTDAGTITNTSSGNTAFLKVTQAKDSNNFVWGVLLPQS